MPRILSVSYDQVLLRTRQMLLEQRGCQVVSCARIDDALTAVDKTSSICSFWVIRFRPPTSSG